MQYKITYTTTLGEMMTEYPNSKDPFLCCLILDMASIANSMSDVEYDVDVIAVFCEQFSEFCQPPQYLKHIVLEACVKSDFVDWFYLTARQFRSALLRKLCEKYGCDFELTFTISKVE